MTNPKTFEIDIIHDRNLLFPEILTSEEIDSLLLDANLGSEEFSVKLGDEFVEVKVIGEKQYIDDKPTMIGTIYIKKGNIYCRVGIIKEDGTTFANADIYKLLKRRMKKLSSKLLLQKTRKIADSIESLSNTLSLNLKDDLNSEYIVGAYEYIKANSSCELLGLNQSSIIHELENSCRDYFNSQACKEKTHNILNSIQSSIELKHDFVGKGPLKRGYGGCEHIPSETLYSVLIVSNLSSEQFSMKISDNHSLLVTIIGEKQYINNNPIMVGYIYINGDNTFIWMGSICADDYTCLPELGLGIPGFKRRIERLTAMLVLRRLKKLGEVKKLHQAKVVDLINTIDNLFKQ